MLVCWRKREGERGERREEGGRSKEKYTFDLFLFRFAPFVEDPCCLTPGPMVYGMATCHSLTTIDGELTGDPLDLKMFNGTKWVSPYDVYVIMKYTFEIIRVDPCC